MRIRGEIGFYKLSPDQMDSIKHKYYTENMTELDIAISEGVSVYHVNRIIKQCNTKIREKEAKNNEQYIYRPGDKIKITRTERTAKGTRAIREVKKAVILQICKYHYLTKLENGLKYTVNLTDIYTRNIEIEKIS